MVKWFPFYPSDWLSGTLGLTPQEKIVYLQILCLIYEREEPVDASAPLLPRQCGVTPATFKKALDVLEGTGKITIKNGLIENKRATKELKFLRNRKKNISAAAKKRWEKSNDFNGRDVGAQYDPTTVGMERARDNHKDINIEANASMTNTGSAGRSDRRPVDVLWQDYVVQVAELTGKSDKQARPLIGRWLKEAKDDAGLVMTAIGAAVEKQPFDPISWISGAINNRKGQAGIAQRMSDEIDKIKSEGGW